MNILLRRAIVVACAAMPVAAWAADTQSAGVLEDIVITAQKRTEKLSDVPVAASVLSADSLGDMNAGDISDINRMVPSVNLNGSINGRVPLGIRGISTVQSEFNVGLASGVAILIDGVPVPSDSRAANALEDVQSVEVLPGPQATFGGRTAAQGVINFVTRKPSDTFQGTVNVMDTSDHERRFNVFVSGPLAAKVDGSLTAYYTEREFPITNTTLNQNTNEKVYGARGKLLFKVNDDLDVTLAARAGKDNSDGMNFVYTHLASGICLLIGPCPPAGTPGFPLGFLEQSVLLPGITPNFNNLTYASPVHAFSNVTDTDGSVDIQWRLGGGYTLSSTSALQHEAQTNVQDLFAVNGYFWNELTGAPGSGAPPFANIQTQAIDVRQFSEEVKLVSPADQQFSYVLGAFYSDTKVSMALARDLLPALDDDVTSPDTKTLDVYAHGTWKLDETNSVVGGLRYNYDTLSYTYVQSAYDASFPPPQLYFGMKDSGSHSQATVVGDIALQHKLSADQMVYAKYSRGYAPAVYNMAQNLTPTNPTVQLVPNTDIDALEAGIKGSFLNRHLSIDADVFYTKYANFQAQAIVPNGSVNPPSTLVSAGAETKGIEVNIKALPTPTLELGLNIALIDAKFTSFANAPCFYPEVAGTVPTPCHPVTAGSSANIQDASGMPMPNAPKVKYTLTADDHIPLGSTGMELRLGGDYAYRSSAQMLADQNPDGIMPSVGILNLHAGVDLAGGKTKITAFANNVLDKVYYTDLEDFWSGPWGGTSAVVAQPARDAHRYFGLRITHNF